MLFIFTTLYFFSMMVYYLNHNIVASVVMISLAIFLYIIEVGKNKRYINIRGLYALGFIGGFGLSLLKLSKLSDTYNFLTFIAVFISYFSLYFGSFIEDRKNRKRNIVIKPYRTEKSSSFFTSQEVLILIIFIVTFLSFVVEASILKFVPLFTIKTPHAYSTFHIFMLHYITTFYIFLPCFALCNYFVNTERNISKVFVIASYIYVVIMALLMVSRSQLVISMVLSLFIVVMYKSKNIKLFKINKNSIMRMATFLILFIILYLIITINRAHNIEYLNGIFEMKNDKMPIFITQPYMYIAHNFENLNYMINKIFRWSFGRKILFPFFTLTFIKKLFPIVVDAPYYVIKEELSTLTIIYDFYYDFGLVGVAVFSFLMGYIGKKIEDKAYFVLNNDIPIKNNYILIMFAYYSYFMTFSFFQTYFSLTDTWVYIIILTIIISFFKMTRNLYRSNVVKNGKSRKVIIEETDYIDNDDNDNIEIVEEEIENSEKEYDTNIEEYSSKYSSYFKYDDD